MVYLPLLPFPTILKEKVVSINIFSLQPNLDFLGRLRLNRRTPLPLLIKRKPIEGRIHPIVTAVLLIIPTRRVHITGGKLRVEVGGVLVGFEVGKEWGGEGLGEERLEVYFLEPGVGFQL